MWRYDLIAKMVDLVHEGDCGEQLAPGRWDDDAASNQKFPSGFKFSKLMFARRAHIVPADGSKELAIGTHVRDCCTRIRGLTTLTRKP